MHFNKYDFHCKWLSDAHMPSFWGSALRGGFGKWLKKIGCVLKTQNCEECIVRESCVYGFVFETEILRNKQANVINARPHPIVIEPPFPAPKETFKENDFKFSLILFNKANDFFPHIFYAIFKLGKEDGIGAKCREGFGRFEINSVSCNGETLFSINKNELSKPSSFINLELLPYERNGCNLLEMFFQTPFRVKYDGRFCRTIPFHVLVRAALRRISSLETAYGAGEPELDYKGLISRAEKVKTVSSDLKWQEIPRFSARQKRKMLIGGPVGRVSYKGDGLSEFVPLLKYCETVHLGKQTFFGLGKIKIELGANQHEVF